MQRSIIISDSFIDSLEGLGNKSRKIVWNKLNKFAINEKSKGFSIHPLKRSDCDKTFKSARINRDLRIIFSQKSNKYILLHVNHHNDAYKWAEGKYLNKNNYGALYIKDKVQIKEAEDEYNKEYYLNKYDNRPSLLEEKAVKLRDLEKLGVDKEIAEKLIKIKDQDLFLKYTSLLPQELGEALLEIVTGNKTTIQIYNQLYDDSIKDNDSMEEAILHKNSKRRFYFVKEQQELEYILKEDIEKWKLFLHPTQEEIVKRDYNGPALIEGGPGTGKTVVGMHRAIYLAKEVFKNGDCKILFCTFSKKLANYINNEIQKLIKQKQAPDVIDVKGVDSIIYKLILRYKLTEKRIDMDRLNQLMEETYLELDPELNYDFYRTEYNEIIQRYNIRNKEEYLYISRWGRVKSISRKKRDDIWDFFKLFLMKKEQNNLIDFEDRAHILYKAIKNNRIKAIYDSIIIDEAQDLSPVKLKVLKGLVKEQANNIFLLSDKNQRIYKLNSWKNDTGLNIVGRSNHLTLNYRTTKQIREYADSQFIENELDNEYLQKYRSIYVGPEPIIKSFNSESEQDHYIVNYIKKRLTQGIKPYEIAIISPVKREEIAGALKYEGIKFSYLKGITYPEEGIGVCVSTLQGCKGLEFKIVIMANYNKVEEKFMEDIDDVWYNKQKIRQVECLKYVACTRARDELIVSRVDIVLTLPPFAGH